MSEEKVNSGEVSAWLDRQVGTYADLAARYRRYAEVLEQVLGRAARDIAPQAIVQTRAKKVPSFAEKALRKRHKYDDPVNLFTDLCGGRVIARTRSEVNAFCEFIEREFDIDWENSLDASQRLKPAEFGYRSIHYIVQLRNDRDYGLPIPEEVYGLKAEIQVRTMVEHAFADFGHDLSYKGAFELPVSWQRELASVAAALEEADQAFSRIEEQLSTYATSYGAYLGEDELQTEIDRLEIVLEHDPDNEKLAARLGKLAITKGNWQKAIEVLEPFVKKKEKPELVHLPILRELGVALRKANRDDPRGDEYRRGQRYLEIASGLVSEEESDKRSKRQPDVDALCSLAGSWKGIDETRVREYYQRAFETDPYDTYALGNYLEHELQHNPGVLVAVRPLMQTAIERCQAQADARVNLPWAFYDKGKFHLLMDEPHKSLEAYSKALSVSSAEFMIETSLRSLERLESVKTHLHGYEWARRLLLLGLAARFPSREVAEAIRELATKGAGPIRPPVLIVAGGTDPRVETQMQSYRELLLEALAGFEGTLISGGTTQGISGLVGDAAQAYPGRIHTIGYLPELIPKDATKDGDPMRYKDIRYTDGHGFSPIEPLQNWIDLLTSGVFPSQVRVLGIGGGTIASAEYRIAMALGAWVGLIAKSGREAGRIFTDAHWAASAVLLSLPPDSETIRAFAEPEPAKMSRELCEPIAQAIHEAYRRERLDSGQLSDSALADWARLSGDYKESNRDQARHIPAKLEAIGCTYVKAKRASGKSVKLMPHEIEVLARMEHGRWVVEKLLKGWKYGPKRDPKKKTNPSLVGWSELSEQDKELDRQTVRKIPHYLEAQGQRIQRVR